jgi:hypothetical protein
MHPGLQRKSFFAVCGKKDWSGKPGFFAVIRKKMCIDDHYG